MSKRPTIKKGPAFQYGASDEAIYEFGDERSGGLISIRRDAEDRLVVQVYRTDDDVRVRSSAMAQS
jgi:hypothetical protein